MHFIKRSGSGVPVVCIHGFCQSSVYWEPLLHHLGGLGIAGLAPDLPGFGASADLPGPTTMEACADGLAAWLTARGIPRIRLVGGSMGGVVAQHFFLRHPARVTRLLLVATGARTADAAGALAKADAMAAGPWDEATVAPIVAGFFHRAPPEADLVRYRRIAAMARQDAAVAAARSNAGSDTLARLGEIAVPVMVIQGRHDRARTPEHGALMCANLPQAELVVIEDAGHTPQLEQQPAFWAMAQPFLTA